RRRHTISTRDWSSDVCSSDLDSAGLLPHRHPALARSIAHIKIFQPLRQGMLATRTAEPIGEQRKDSLRQQLSVAQRRLARVQYIDPRESWSNRCRATKIGPQVEARGVLIWSAETQRGAATSACSNRTKV